MHPVIYPPPLRNTPTGPLETRDTAWHSFIEEYCTAVKTDQHSKWWLLRTVDQWFAMFLTL